MYSIHPPSIHLPAGRRCVSWLFVSVSLFMCRLRRTTTPKEPEDRRERGI